MLNVNRNLNFRGRASVMLITRFSALSLLLIFGASSQAQSSSDLAETHQWVKSKAQDSRGKALMLQRGPGTDGPCYDPLPCIAQDKREWESMSGIARADGQASPTVKNTIQKIVEGLSAAERRWRALSPAEKTRLARTVEEIRTSLGGATQKNKVEQGLQKIADDPARSQETRSTAKTLLTVSRRRDGFGTLADIFKCTRCVCVTAENCPCCDYGLPSDIWDSTKWFPN